MKRITYTLDGDDAISTRFAPTGEELRKLNDAREDLGRNVFDDLDLSIPTPPSQKRGISEFFAALKAGASLDEARKKLRGNLCVLTGTGSGGGFVPCNAGSFGRSDKPGLQAHRKATAMKLLDLRQKAKEAVAKGDPHATAALKGTMKERGPKALTVALAVATAKKAAELVAIKKANEEAAAKAAAEALANKVALDVARADALVLATSASDIAGVLPPNHGTTKTSLKHVSDFISERAEAAYQGKISPSYLASHVADEKKKVLFAIDTAIGSTKSAKGQIEALKKEMDGITPDYSTPFGSKVGLAKSYLADSGNKLEAYVGALAKMKEDVANGKDVKTYGMVEDLGTAMTAFKAAVTTLAAANEIKKNGGAVVGSKAADSAQVAVTPLTAAGLTIKSTKTGKVSVDPKYLSPESVKAYVKKAAQLAGQEEPPKLTPAKLKSLAAAVATVDYLKEKGYSTWSKNYKSAKKAADKAIAAAYAGKYGFAAKKNSAPLKPEDLPQGSLLAISGKTAAGKWAAVLKKRQERFAPIIDGEDITHGLTFAQKNELTSKSNAWYSSGLTYAEKQAVYHYTSSGYMTMNKELRSGGSVSVETLAAVSAVRKGTGMLPPHTMIFRGQTMTPEIQSAIDAFKAGDRKVTLLKRGMSSASLNYSFAKDWMGSKLVLRFRDHGTYVAPNSAHSHEEEVIVPPGKFRLVNVHSRGGVTIVDLEPMERPKKETPLSLVAGPLAGVDTLDERKAKAIQKLGAFSTNSRFSDNVVDGVEIEPIGDGEDDMPPIEESADDARQTWLNMSEQARTRVRALIEAAKKGSKAGKGACCDSCKAGKPCEK